MGEIDSQSVHYLSKNEPFTDALNFFYFQGEQRFHPEDFQPLDSREVILLKNKSKQIQRDVFKVYAAKKRMKATYILCGIESQSYVDYGMAARNLMMDVMNYHKQYRKIQKEHDRKKDLKGDEYLSRFSKQDRLHPIFTLVLYLKAGKWDGIQTFQELIEGIEDIEPEMRKYLPNYHFGLICPSMIQDKDFQRFTTPLGNVMQFVKYSEDMNALKKNNQWKSKL